VSYLVFDIETIPDLSVWTPPATEAPPPDPAAPLPGQLSIVGAPVPPADSAIVIPPLGTPVKKPRARKKPANGEPAKEPFAPHYAHRVVAIGWTWLELDNGAAELKGMGCVGTSTFKDDEAALISAWNDFVRREGPTIVTYNGRAFDVPVLGLRALRHGVSQAWADKDYRYRYGERHLDVFEHVTEYGLVPRTGFSLDVLSQLIGLPAKGETNGASISAMFAKGDIAKLEAYCASDSVKTAFLLLRYFLMRGRVSKDQYVVMARMLLEACAAQGLGSITFGVDTKRLLLE